MNTTQPPENPEPGPLLGLGSSDVLGPLPEAAGYRTRYRSEPGMIGHYPWTYADQSRRRRDRPECDYEDLYTDDQVRALLAAEREKLQDVAMMLRTCAWALRRGTAPELGERALELLKRHDLLGSPLRA